MKRTPLALAALALVVLGLYLPATRRGLNAMGCGLVEEAIYWPAAQIFRVLSAVGDADATNNLGVLYRKGWGVQRDNGAAYARFQSVLTRGHHIQAAYNLAEMLPSPRGDAPAKIATGEMLPASGVRQRIVSLLETNVKDGDVHSAVLLANKLNSVSYNGEVEDYVRRRLELLRMGAVTGDAAYRYKFADQLIDGARALEGGDERASMFDEAWPHLIAADAAGDPRAAHLIAFVLNHALQASDPSPPESIMARDALSWQKRAADMGLMAAKCGYGQALYDGQLAQAASVAENDPVLIEALPNLQACASSAIVDDQTAPAFSSPALYAVKLRGSHPSITTGRGWARMALGRIYSEGLGVTADVARARDYFRAAAEQDDFEDARQALSRLQN